MSLKSIYAQNGNQEKTAEAFAEEVKATLGVVTESAYRARLQKLSEATAADYAANRNEDKGGMVVLEKAKEQIARGIYETGRMKGMTGDELKTGGSPTQGPQDLASGGLLGGAQEAEKVAEDLTGIAAYLNLVKHAQIASNKTAYLTKVACPVCSGSRCEVCDNLGSMSKIAAEQVISSIDQLGSLIAADQMLKQADEVQGAEGRDSMEYQAMGAKLDQAQAMADNVSETLVSQSPGMGWPTAPESTEEMNPVLNMIGINRVHKIK